MKLKLIIAVIALIASCGGGDQVASTATEPAGREPAATSTTSPTAPTTSDDPCGYVDAATVGQILGFEVEAVDSGPTSCEYGPTDPAESGGAGLVFEEVSSEGCGPAFQLAGFEGAEQIDGVGSYAAYTEGFVPQLAVCFDDSLVLIASLGAESADPPGTLLEVAQAVELGLD